MHRHRAEMREKGSRFVATAIPAGDETEMRAAIDSVRTEFPDATHHCWASFLGGRRAEPEERCHDAGEPAGTAGPPILQAIRAAGVTNLVVVVTRYFGGTKLGKGGLARAYRGAATRVLQGAPRVTAVPMSRILIHVPLRLDGETRHLLARHGGRVDTSSHDDDRTSVLRASVPAEARARFEEALQEIARGEARIGPTDRAPA
jgi:putative IMPACT (imprinted ancient) family translation regulator